MKVTLVSGALCLVLGLGLGQLLSSAAPTSAPAPVLVQAAPAAIVASGGLGRAELAAVVREELARQRPATPEVATGPAELELEPEQHARAERGEAVVHAAIARGVWTAADRDALATSFEDLPGPVKAEIAAQLADAVNRDLVQLDLEGFPL